MAKIQSYRILIIPEQDIRVLQEALEAHASGLEDAKEHVTVDPMLKTPEDLTEVTGSIDEDIARCNGLLEALGVNRS